MKRRGIALLSAVVLLVAMTAWGTWAYFTADAHATNVITTGTLRIVLNDTMKGAVVEAGETGQFALLEGVMPGTEVSKQVSVTNSGTGTAWIRIKLATTITGEDGENLPATVFHDGKTENAVQIACNTGAAGDWLDGGDGYYYYTKPLAAGDTTGNLFDTVTLNPFLSNAYQDCQVEIAVSAQAVQAKNNEIDTNQGQTVLNIQGWPAD